MGLRSIPGRVRPGRRIRDCVGPFASDYAEIQFVVASSAVRGPPAGKASRQRGSNPYRLILCGTIRSDAVPALPGAQIIGEYASGPGGVEVTITQSAPIWSTVSALVAVSAELV